MLKNIPYHIIAELKSIPTMPAHPRTIYIESLHLHLHLYVDPSLIDYNYSTGLTSGGNARKDENKENIGNKK